jgi:hypothetical protein
LVARKATGLEYKRCTPHFRELFEFELENLLEPELTSGLFAFINARFDEGRDLSIAGRMALVIIWGDGSAVLVGQIPTILVPALVPLGK